MLALGLACAILAVERVQHQARHVDRREERRGQSQGIAGVQHDGPWNAEPMGVSERRSLSASEYGSENLVLRKESGEWRDARDGQCGDPHQDEGPRHVL